MTQCHPLEEAVYKRVIFDNYYDPLKFWFELDHAQTRVLTSLFRPSQNPINFRTPPVMVSLVEALKKPKKMESEKRKKGKEVVLRQSYEETISDWEVLAESKSSNSNSSSNESGSNGDTQNDKREKERMLVILRKMAAGCQSRDPSSSRGVGCVEASSSRESSAFVDNSDSYENSNFAHHEVFFILYFF